MYFTIATILFGVVVPIGVPAYLVAVMWLSRFKTMADWWVNLSGVVVVAALFYLIIRWDVIGYLWRLPISVGSIAIAGCSYIRQIRRVQKGGPRSQRDYLRLGLTALPVAALAAACIWILAASTDPERGLRIRYPLRNGTYYVGNGGDTWLTNIHSAVESQSWALDILRLEDCGRRASSLYPSELEKYAIYGDTVYSPIAGEVAAVVDSLPDLQPPAYDRTRPAGNHIVIRTGDRFILLAHLKQGSARVKTGDRVAEGDIVALVGNSGNTSEPHLHIHAVTGSPQDSNIVGWVGYRGSPVPLLFEGTSLKGNDIFP